MAEPRRHRPVLVREVLAVLAPRDGAVYVDGTFGGGGYSRALLEAARCTVWGIDRDPAALAGGAALASEFTGRLDLVGGRFGDMDRLLAGRAVDNVDGVVLDLGVSSMQIADGARGFSFLNDGPLDMRMESDGRSAADVVNASDEKTLADLIHGLGEERKARRTRLLPEVQELMGDFSDSPSAKVIERMQPHCGRCRHLGFGLLQTEIESQHHPHYGGYAPRRSP